MDGGADEHPENNATINAKIIDRQTGIFEVSHMNILPVVILRKLVFNLVDCTTHTLQTNVCAIVPTISASLIFTRDSVIRMRPIAKFLVVTALLSLAACESDPVELRLIAPASDLDLEIIRNLEVLLDQSPAVRIRVTDDEQTGEAALDMLIEGKADLALISNYLPYREDIATVMPLYPSVLHIAYRIGRDASSGPALLNQANIYAGKEGSASRLMLETIVARMNIPKDAYSYAERPSAGAMEPPDVVVIFAPISPKRVAEFDGYRLFSIGSPSDIGTGSAIDAATALNPPLRSYIIPATIYGAATPEPIVTVAVDKLLVARSDLDPSVVYDLVNEIRRLQPALSATRPGLFEQLSDGFDVSRSTFVVHAGTQDYLQRSEPTIYERYSGVAEVVVTLLIALISVTLAGIRVFKMRRKNRIDRFYSAAIDIRDSVTDASSNNDLGELAIKVRELQDDAFDQLVDEKLAADESFRIFITLSNDILAQIDAKH
jgi:TRAP-type uncharacterized transport system substrate-binding protein